MGVAGQMKPQRETLEEKPPVVAQPRAAPEDAP